MGYSENISDSLPGFDVFILPSKSEGLSVTILEAMAAGIPVIATDVGGNKEVINNSSHDCT